MSLLGACRFRLRRLDGSGAAEMHLEPRSAYVLGGEARQSWQHGIPPAASLRDSVTFRTLHEGPGGAAAGR